MCEGKYVGVVGSVVVERLVWSLLFHSSKFPSVDSHLSHEVSEDEYQG